MEGGRVTSYVSMVCALSHQLHTVHRRSVGCAPGSILPASPGILKSIFQVVHVHVFTLGLVSSFTGAGKSLPLCKLT